jgi:hypothetical protein
MEELNCRCFATPFTDYCEIKMIDEQKQDDEPLWLQVLQGLHFGDLRDVCYPVFERVLKCASPELLSKVQLKMIKMRRINGLDHFSLVEEAITFQEMQSIAELLVGGTEITLSVAEMERLLCHTASVHEQVRPFLLVFLIALFLHHGDVEKQSQLFKRLIPFRLKLTEDDTLTLVSEESGFINRLDDLVNRLLPQQKLSNDKIEDYFRNSFQFSFVTAEHGGVNVVNNLYNHCATICQIFYGDNA